MTRRFTLGENMKKIFLFAFLFMTAIDEGELFAQTQSVSQSANVNLTVQTAMSLTNVRGVNFGTQVQGSAGATVDPVNGGANAAYFTLSGAPANQSLTVSWTPSAILTNTTTNITWTPSVAVGNTTTQTGATVLASSGSTSPASSSGNLYIWVGGSTGAVPNNAPAGLYQGTVTLTVQY